ncbi:alanine racemase [Mycobacterium sp. NPDC048908]|uniref:alanine racemase n=1 Tax=Mycobacterium sp. NPDC048908 TaxID=3364292 RepID=UPI00371F417A
MLADGTVFSPVMVLKASALAHNIAALHSYCDDNRVLVAPHGKTTMSPELINAQLSAGAWAISAATPAQVRAFWEFGVRRILLANELVDPAGIAWIAQHLASHEQHEFFCYVDSLHGIHILEEILGALDIAVRLEVLVELARQGTRTGVRTLAEAKQVARAAAESPHLRLRGVAGYEGALVSNREEESIEAVASYCRFVTDAAAALDEEQLFDGPDVILSVGGGAFFDIVVDVLKEAALPYSKPLPLIRPGCYITHDHGLYERIAAFAQPGSSRSLQPALEIWGRILSRPETGLAFADFGRRDVAFDQDMPVVLTVAGFKGEARRPGDGFVITALNDQHAFITLPADDPVKPGDWIGCGISHPCTTFDKWRHIPLVDDNYVVTGSVTTYF